MQDFLIFPAFLLLLIWMLFRSFTRAIRTMARNPDLRMMLLTVLALLAGGTYVFHRVERWDVLDSLYYCVITLTTVGYGDVTPQTDLGKAVAIVYILLGIGVIMAFVTTLAQVAVAQVKETHGARLGARRHGQDRPE